MQLQKHDAARVFGNAKYAARQFCRRQTHPWLDPEDVRQDFLVDLLARLKGYDPERGSLSTFASMCFEHRAARLGARANRDALHRRTVSFDTLLPKSSDITYADVLADGDSWSGASGGDVARIDRLLDLDRALGSLPEATVPLCTLLLVDQFDPVNASGLPRTTFYRRVSEIRCHLLAAGISVTRAARAGAR